MRNIYRDGVTVPAEDCSSDDERWDHTTGHSKGNEALLVPRDVTGSPKGGGEQVSDELAQKKTLALDLLSKGTVGPIAKFERPGGSRMATRQVKHKASIRDVRAGTHQVNSVDPAIFDKHNRFAMVDLYCGGGGMGHGLVTKMGDVELVCVLAVDRDKAACQTHRLSHPEVPVVQAELISWTQVYQLIEEYLPKQHWGKLWVHASNPCQSASMQNGTNRDLDQAEADTRWLIGCLNNVGPAIWTIENVPPLYDRVKHLAPFHQVVKMERHCALCQPRRRMILASRAIVLPSYQGKLPTLHQLLAPSKGWHPDAPLLQRTAWNDHKTTHGPAYVVTSGAHYAGAKSLSEFSPQHLLDWRDKATLQSFVNTRQITFPIELGEQGRKRIVANMVPPAFAKVLCLAAIKAMQQSQAAHKLEHQLQVAQEMSDSDCSEDDASGTRRLAVRSVTMTETATHRGRHGSWHYHPRLGWRSSKEVSKPEQWEGLEKRLSEQPWLKIKEPPLAAETHQEWHNRLTTEQRESERHWKERWAMVAEDKEPHTQLHIAHVRKQGQRTGTHVSDIGSHFYTRVDANAEGQKREPNWYGPYLQEGERYATERTKENVAQATQLMAGNLPAHLKSYYSRFEELVYHFWVLFDGKMRAVHGVELDMDLSHVKPIRRQPYKWSPQKTEAGKLLVQKFLEQGLVSPSTSEWAAPALLVSKRDDAAATPSPSPSNQTTPIPVASPVPKSTSVEDDWRLVVDYRELNKVMAMDRFEPPSCELCINWLAGRSMRTVMDLRWGFHQCGISERMKQYFTFVTSFGTYTYNRLVMGFCNATAEFQRVTNHTLGDSLWRICVAMVDDLVVATEDQDTIEDTAEQHLTDLWEVFTKLAARGHSLKPKKVKFAQEEVEYLGRILTSWGTMVTPRHKTAVALMPYPLDDDGCVNVTSLRSGIGLFKFCRQYIPKCAWLCAPLNELTTLAAGTWGNLESVCWEVLKYFILHSKGLHHLNYRLPIYVCTDGSKRGVGGYIYQRKPGEKEERVCSYFSRQTTKDERKWDTRELELLAVLATLEAHHHLIDGQEVVLQTDHRNLTYLMNLKEPSGRLGRWVLRLSEHKFKIEYRKGETMNISDCMSRNPQASPTSDTETPKQYECLLMEQHTSYGEDEDGAPTFQGFYQLMIDIAPEERQPKGGGEPKPKSSNCDETNRSGVSGVSGKPATTGPTADQTHHFGQKVRHDAGQGRDQRDRGESHAHRGAPGELLTSQVAAKAEELRALAQTKQHTRHDASHLVTPKAQEKVTLENEQLLELREEHGQASQREGDAHQGAPAEPFRSKIDQELVGRRAMDQTSYEGQGRARAGTTAPPPAPPPAPVVQRDRPVRPLLPMVGASHVTAPPYEEDHIELETSTAPPSAQSASKTTARNATSETLDSETLRAVRRAEALDTPREQMPQLISANSIMREQGRDAHIEEVKVELEKRQRGEAHRDELVRHFEMYNGMVCRLTRAEHAHEDSLRPYLPKSLQDKVMHNFHTSVLGAHRSAASTYHEVASRYYWPGMQDDVVKFVSTCAACQLGKGACPTRQGLLHGRHYNHAFANLCMDLVGPINQESGVGDRFILTIVDPFTHFVWLEIITTKHADHIVNAFVNRILLEEGAPAVILTDNGSEFKNKVLKDLMHTLEIKHQFSPRYLPRSNQAERTNRYITETLRTVVRAPGAAARDWQGYLKYIEFAMRRTPIPGTNLTPFEVMRGRAPLLAIDLPLVGDVPRLDLSVDEHTRRLKEYKEKAEQLVKSAMEKVKAKNADLWNLAHHHCEFQPGDKVRYWSAQSTSGGQAAKLKLRNGVYEIVRRHEGSDRYDLRHCEHPELNLDNIHVSFLARWRSADTPGARAQAGPAAPSAQDVNDDNEAKEQAADDAFMEAILQDMTERRKWQQLRVNQLVCFVMRDEPPCNLRIAEVQELDTGKMTMTVQYWIDCTPGSYKPHMPIGQRRLKPEWQDSKGQTRLKSKATPASVKWEPRLDDLGLADIEIVQPVVKTQVGGKVTPAHVETIEAWLRRKSKEDSRASKALRRVSLREHSADKRQGDQLRALADRLQATNAGAGDDASHDASGQTTNAEVVRMLRALSNECATQSLAWQEQQERTRSDQSEVGPTARPVQHTGTVARGRAMTKAGGDL